MVADTYALTSENRLVYFERASGSIRSSAEISGLAAGESIVGVDFRPAGGELFALATTRQPLYGRHRDRRGDAEEHAGRRHRGHDQPL